MKKTEVLTKLDALVSEAIDTYELTESWSYFRALYSAVDYYYSHIEEVSEEFAGVLIHVYTKLETERLVFENDAELGITHDLSIPVIDGAWYKWGWLDNPLPIDCEYDEIGERIVSAEQPRIMAICAEVKGARDKEVAALDKLQDSYIISTNRMDLKRMLAERGKCIEYPEKDDVVSLLYNPTGAKKQILDNELDVYMPEAIKND